MRMFSRSGALAAFAVASALAAPALADKLMFSGTHSIKFSHNGHIKEVSASGTSAGSSSVAIVNGSAGPLSTLQFTRPFAKITTNVVRTSLETGISEIRLKGVRIHPNLAGPKGQPGVFKPIRAAAQGGMTLTGNTLPAAGTIRLCNVIGCPGSVALVLPQTNGAGVAVGPGVTSLPPIVVKGMTGPTTNPMTGPTLSVMGHPWTVNTTAVQFQTEFGGVDTLSDMGFACGPAAVTMTVMGATGCSVNGNGTTLNASSMGMRGVVQLVSGIQTTCVGCGGNNSPGGAITRLTLNLAPEPGRFALLAAGALALVQLGRRARVAPRE